MTANEKQEGGNHYKQESERGNPQHWDLAIMYGWDPFQYQIIKYVMRWKDKFPTPDQRLTDLKKARHFLDKYIENWEKYDTHKETPPLTNVELTSLVESMRMAGRPDSMKDSDSHWSCEGFLGNGRNVYQCRHCKGEVTTRTLEMAYDLHPDCSKAHIMFSAP